MPYARRVDSHPLNSPLFSSNAAYEKKEKYHYFTHSAKNHTNFHSHFNQRERMGTWEKEETHTRSKKK